MRISVLSILLAAIAAPAWTGCSRSDHGAPEASQASAAENAQGEADPSSDSASGSASGTDAMNSENTQKQYPVQKSEQEWKQELTEKQYHILREQGTERAFTGEHWDEKRPGTYVCAGCGQPLYSSETKFESGTGWPSFYQPVEQSNIETREDRSWFSVRTEVLCSRCGGHLGHVFDDGPEPTGKRHCINSAALQLVESDGDEKKQDQQ